MAKQDDKNKEPYQFSGIRWENGKPVKDQEPDIKSPLWQSLLVWLIAFVVIGGFVYLALYIVTNFEKSMGG